MTAAAPAEHSPTRSTGDTSGEVTRREVKVLIAITVAATATTLWWAIPVVRASGRTFDISDEGFYLLSYRWWNVEYRNFTGAQFLYGPVFALLGHNVALLRLFRLLTVLGSHAALGLAFARWVRTTHPPTLPARWRDAAITSSVIASGGFVYNWLPSTPGYNDVAILASLVLAGLVLEVLARARGERPVSWWLPYSAGVVTVVMLLGKWSSALATVTLLAAAAIVVLWPSGWRLIARLGGWAALGVATAAIACALLIDLGRFLPAFFESTSAASETTSGIGTILRTYVDNVTTTARRSVRVGMILLPILGVIAALAKPAQRRVASVVIGVGFAAAYLNLWRVGGFKGGSGHLAVNILGPIALTVTAVTVLVASQIADRTPEPDNVRHHPDAPVIGMLLLLPLAQAAGTNNGILFTATNAFGAWACVIVLVAVTSGTRWKSSPPRTTVGAALLVGLLILAAAVGQSGSWDYPYRSAPARYGSTKTDLPALSSLHLAPPIAAGFDSLGQHLEPWIRPEGRRILAFDEMAGVVFALDGRPVGEAWLSSGAPGRNAAGIRWACRDGVPWQRAPLVITRRALTTDETDALEVCGVDLDRYRELDLGATDNTLGGLLPSGFAVLVPK